MNNNSGSKTDLRRLLGTPGPRPFLILAELLPEGGFNPVNIERFLGDYAGGGDSIPKGFRLAGVTLPQNPRGIAAMSPTDVFTAVDKRGLWADLDVIPHLTAKDMGIEAIRSELFGLERAGLSSVLALTGDKPSRGKGVFDVDSVGLLDLIEEMNLDSFRRAGNRPFDEAHLFFPLAAVSPFKYTKASEEQQYFKMKKKIRAGAAAFITQLGWDWRKSEGFFRRLGEMGISVPVFGNVFLIHKTTPGLRLMVEGQMPGCFMSREMYAGLLSEDRRAAIERAAVQTAMYRDLGADGIDLGGLASFADMTAILERAGEIGAAWREHRDMLAFGPVTLPGGATPYYRFDENGVDISGRTERKHAPAPRAFFRFLHKNFLEDGRRFNPAVKAVAGSSGSFRRSQGTSYRLFLASENGTKSLLFGCRECGDCHLPENLGYCTLGECGKGLSNVPCGDSDPSGRCGNNKDIRCIGELIYNAAAAQGPAALKDLENRTMPPRNPALNGTSAVLNYLLGRDHTRTPGFTPIGENMHATISKVRGAMQELLDRGEQAFDEPSGALAYLKGLIRAQVRHGAAYIDVNVDEFGKDDLELRKRMMRDYVRLVKRTSDGTPVCVDSGSVDVLEAGLEAWYKDGTSSAASSPLPMINSVKLHTMDRLLPLAHNYPFKFVALLVDENSAGKEGVYGVDELYGLARRIFQEAIGKYGFKSEDIYFDSTVFPLVIDVPMAENSPGYTYRAFETIRKIRKDQAMKGVHLSLGITNAVRDLPGRQIGVCRAYLARAVEYGLDTAIVNVLHDFGLKPVDQELLGFVDAFIRQDGSSEAAQRSVEALKRFCRENRKPSKR